MTTVWLLIVECFHSPCSMIHSSHFLIHFLDFVHFLMSFVLTSSEVDCLEEQSDVVESVICIPRLVTFPSIGDERISPIMQWEGESSGTTTKNVYFDQAFIQGNCCNGVDSLRDRISTESDNLILIRSDKVEFDGDRRNEELKCTDAHHQSSNTSTDIFGLVAQCRQILPEQIRWFYKQESDKKLTPFIGFDSLRIELKYRELHEHDLNLYESSLSTLSDDDVKQLKNHEKIVVRGGLYEVDVKDRLCSSIFWAGMKVTLLLLGVLNFLKLVGFLLYYCDLTNFVCYLFGYF